MTKRLVTKNNLNISKSKSLNNESIRKGEKEKVRKTELDCTVIRTFKKHEFNLSQV